MGMRGIVGGLISGRRIAHWIDQACAEGGEAEFGFVTAPSGARKGGHPFATQTPCKLLIFLRVRQRSMRAEPGQRYPVTSPNGPMEPWFTRGGCPEDGGFFEEFILQPEAFLVGFDGSGGFHDSVNPGVHLELAKVESGQRTVPGVVIGKTGVPPDSGIDVLRQLCRPRSPRTRAWPDPDAPVRDARSASPRFRLHRRASRGHYSSPWSARRRLHSAEHIHHIVMGLFQLALSKERQQVFVSAVPVHDDDLLTTVARHLVGGFLQQLQLELPAVRNGTGLVPGFKDLAKVILGKTTAYSCSAACKAA